TMKPTWFTTDPLVPPVGGGVPGAASRVSMTPGNVTRWRPPAWKALPPMPTKIFSLTATSFELRCQWPLVTPASLNGNGCAAAVPAAKVDASNKAANTVVFMGCSMLELDIRRGTGGRVEPCG